MQVRTIVCLTVKKCVSGKMLHHKLVMIGRESRDAHQVAEQGQTMTTQLQNQLKMVCKIYHRTT